MQRAVEERRQQQQPQQQGSPAKWLFLSLCLALFLVWGSLVVMEHHALLSFPRMVLGRNEAAAQASRSSLASLAADQSWDFTPVAAQGEDEAATPGPCDAARAENALLVSTDVPPSMSTMPAMAGVVDPSAQSRAVYLPWDRDDWCTVSPCLTVSDAKHRDPENRRFQAWLKDVRSQWMTPFDPLIFQHEGAMYWRAPRAGGSSTLYLRNATHGFEYMDAIAPLENATSCEHWMNAPGSILLWFSFQYANYGHFMHDHAPALVALLDILGSSVSWVALPYSELSDKWLCWLDPALRKRIIFYPPEQVVCSTATILTPLSRRGEGGARWRLPSTASLFNKKTHELHHQTPAEEPRPKLVFASRNSSTARHGRALANEQEVLATVRRMMQLYDRPEELVVYNGEGVSYEEQFQLFASAALVIGPHGSAMSNMMWTRRRPRCEDPVQVVEFVGSRVSGPKIQSSYHGYYFLEGSVPWVQYHMLPFSPNSTKEATYVSPSDVESVLAYIWRGRDAGATTCYAAIRR